MLLWSLLCLLVLVAAVAAGYYLWLDAKVAAANDRVTPDVLEALAESPSTSLAPSTTASMGTTSTTEQVPEPPGVMDILLVGADRRKTTSKINGLSDTLILVHVDPENDYISTLSLPRDLRVEVKGYGKQKLNTAYSYGGPALAIRTIQDLTGVDIDHYLGVDFTAFRDMTNELGGVYVEVDRRYYYDGGAYEKISLQPGYQLLSGANALDYVRFRHDSNLDFGRMERQQRFLSAVRQQAMGWDLGIKLPGLIGAFFDNVATDMGTNDIIKLAWWGIRLDGSRIRQVTLRGSTQTIGGGSYVIASAEKMKAAVQAFLAVPGSETEQSELGADVTSTTSTTTVATVSLDGIQVDVFNATAPSGSGAAAAAWLRERGATVVNVGNSIDKVAETQVWYPAGALSAAQRVAAAFGTSNTRGSDTVARVTLLLGSDLSPPQGFVNPESVPEAAVWKGVAKKVSFAVQAPAYIPSQYSMSKRSPNNATIYKIKAGDESWPTLVMLYKLKGAEQYMNITETTWLDAPLASPGRVVVHEGTAFTTVFVGEEVERVWWKSDGVLYWVSNTLSRLATEEELLTVAKSMVRVQGQ